MFLIYSPFVIAQNFVSPMLYYTSVPCVKSLQIVLGQIQKSHHLLTKMYINCIYSNYFLVSRRHTD